MVPVASSAPSSIESPPLTPVLTAKQCGGVTKMLSETWEDQYRRMHRQYDLLKRTADQHKFEEIHERARDILYHFCCDAFHLKDWIFRGRSDRGHQRRREEVRPEGQPEASIDGL